MNGPSPAWTVPSSSRSSFSPGRAAELVKRGTSDVSADDGSDEGARGKVCTYERPLSARICVERTDKRGGARTATASNRCSAGGGLHDHGESYVMHHMYRVPRVEDSSGGEIRRPDRRIVFVVSARKIARDGAHVLFRRLAAKPCLRNLDRKERTFFARRYVVHDESRTRARSAYAIAMFGKPKQRERGIACIPHGLQVTGRRVRGHPLRRRIAVIVQLRYRLGEGVHSAGGCHVTSGKFGEVERAFQMSVRSSIPRIDPTSSRDPR